MRMRLTKPKTKKEKRNSGDLVLAIRIESLTRLQPKANKQTNKQKMPGSLDKLMGIMPLTAMQSCKETGHEGDREETYSSRVSAPICEQGLHWSVVGP